MAVAYKERNNKRWAIKIGDWVYKEGVTRGEALEIMTGLNGTVNHIKIVHLSGGKHV